MESHHSPLITVGVMLALTLPLGPCARAVAQEQPAAAHSESWSAAVQDTTTTAQVKKALAADRRLHNAVITVHTTDGVVTITGSASGASASAAAEEDAKSVRGVTRVDASGLQIASE